jgi:hypothetical protein
MDIVVVHRCCWREKRKGESVETNRSRAGKSDELSRRGAIRRIGAGGLAAALLTRGLTPAAAEDATPVGGTPEAAGGAYLAIRQYALAANAAMDELLGRVETGFVPIVRGVPGYQEYIFVDTGGGTLMTISVFDDQAGAEESTRRAADWVKQNLAGMFQGPPTVTTGTVRLHDLGGGATAATPAP